VTWLDHVRADPRPWLLDEDTPACGRLRCGGCST
jgi:hypothetical protein